MTKNQNIETRIIGALDSDNIASQIEGIMHDDQIDHSQLADVLANLHNTNKINLLKLASSDTLSNTHQFQFFQLSYIFQKALPHIKATAIDVAEAIKSLVEKGGDDIVASQPFSAFRQWCENDLTRCTDIFDLARQDDEAALFCLTHALVAKGDLAPAEEFAFQCEGRLRVSGISALPRISTTLDKTEQNLRLLKGVVEETNDIMTRANVIVASCALFEMVGGLQFDKVKIVIDSAIEPQTTEIIFALLQSIERHYVVLAEEDIEYLLDYITPSAFNEIHQGHIDSTILALFQHDRQKSAIYLMKRWLLESEETPDLENLKHFSKDFRALPQPLITEIFVEWMLHEEVILHKALGKAFLDIEAPPLELEMTSLNRTLAEVEEMTLCRRIVGYFILSPLIPAGVIKSLLATCSDRAAVHIIEVLKHSLLLNYLGHEKLLEYLSQGLSQHPRGQNIKSALEWVRQIRLPLESDQMKELRPSPLHSQVQNEIKQEMDKEVQDQAEANSLLMKIATKQVLLFGSASVHYVHDGVDLRQVVTPMHEIEVSSHLPSQSRFDPVGLELDNLFLRRGTFQQ